MSRKKTIDDHIAFLKERLNKKCCGTCVYCYHICIEEFEFTIDTLANKKTMRKMNGHCGKCGLYFIDPMKLLTIDGKHCKHYIPHMGYAEALIRFYELDKKQQRRIEL